MELGQRIRQARLEAGLTQRQLCGETITRNMLSQIENGSAHPSMDTLCFLAAGLGKSISYFLDESVASPNQTVILAAREAYTNGEFAQAIEILEDYKSPDPVFQPEYALLESLLHLKKAETVENPDDIRQFLADVARFGQQTPYYTPELERRRLLCLSQVEGEYLLPPEDDALLLRASIAFKQGNIDRCIQLLSAVEMPQDPKWLFLRGDAALHENDFSTAEHCYRQAETLSPKAAWPKLENLYQKTENYKLAYHYACLQRETH